jgi:hypothetical protein
VHQRRPIGPKLQRTAQGSVTQRACLLPNHFDEMHQPPESQVPVLLAYRPSRTARMTHQGRTPPKSSCSVHSTTGFDRPQNVGAQHESGRRVPLAGRKPSERWHVLVDRDKPPPSVELLLQSAGKLHILPDHSCVLEAEPRRVSEGRDLGPAPHTTGPVSERRSRSHRTPRPCSTQPRSRNT